MHTGDRMWRTEGKRDGSGSRPRSILDPFWIRVATLLISGGFLIRVASLIDFAPCPIRVQTLIPQVPKWEPNGPGRHLKHEENAQSPFCAIRVATLINFRYEETIKTFS